MTLIITWLLGPFMFYLLSHVLYIKEKHKKYPVGTADGLGDVVFLPLFNAAVVYYGIIPLFFSSAVKIFIASILCFVASTAFLIWMKDSVSRTDWSRPRQHYFNFGGWYHYAFYVAESFFIFLGILHFYDKLLVWIPLIGYVLTGLYYVFIQATRIEKGLKT